MRESPLAAHSTGGELDLPALRGHLESLTADGADVVVCTCSTLGAAAEQLGHEMGVAMVRIGRPMADAAVRAGCRIGVVIAAPSAVAPAREVLRTSAAAAGGGRAPHRAPLPGRVGRVRDRRRRSLRQGIADAARAVAPGQDAIVLAQASMAGAAPLLRDLNCPVLTSPGSAVVEAVRLVGTGASRRHRDELRQCGMNAE